MDEVKPPRASKALKEHWDMAVMSKRLATINVDADFPYELDEAKLGISTRKRPMLTSRNFSLRICCSVLT